MTAKAYSPLPLGPSSRRMAIAMARSMTRTMSCEAIGSELLRTIRRTTSSSVACPAPRAMRITSPSATIPTKATEDRASSPGADRMRSSSIHDPAGDQHEDDDHHGADRQQEEHADHQDAQARMPAEQPPSLRWLNAGRLAWLVVAHGCLRPATAS